MDFFEKTQAPSTSRQGIRRSAASDVRVASSMARYLEASLTLITSFGVGVNGAPFSFDLLRVLRLAQRLELRLQPADAFEERLEGFGHGVRQVGLVEIDGAHHALAVA